MSKEAEQSNPRHTKCKSCGEFSVHHFNSKFLLFIGDEEDAQGGESEFNDIEVQTDASVFGHICTNPGCREMQDIGIEDPQELDFAKQLAETEAKLLIKRLLNDSLPRELDHDWEYHQGAVICEKCKLFDIKKEDNHSFAFDIDGKLQYIAYGVAPPCSGLPNLAWWDKKEQ